MGEEDERTLRRPSRLMAVLIAAWLLGALACVVDIEWRFAALLQRLRDAGQVTHINERLARWTGVCDPADRAGLVVLACLCGSIALTPLLPRPPGGITARAAPVLVACAVVTTLVVAAQFEAGRQYELAMRKAMTTVGGFDDAPDFPAFWWTSATSRALDCVPFVAAAIVLLAGGCATEQLLAPRGGAVVELVRACLPASLAVISLLGSLSWSAWERVRTFELAGVPGPSSVQPTVLGLLVLCVLLARSRMAPARPPIEARV